MKKALITGVTGQDGSYLAELLLEKGYQVWGVMRRSSSFHTGRIDHLYRDLHEHPQLRLVHGDLDLDWQQYVEIDPRYFRPSEVDYLEGDPGKAKKVLKWRPKVGFKELAGMMTDADMIIAEREKIIEDHQGAQQ